MALGVMPARRPALSHLCPVLSTLLAFFKQFDRIFPVSSILSGLQPIYRVTQKRAPTSDARHFLSYPSNLLKLQTQLAYYILHLMPKHDEDQPVFVYSKAMRPR